MVRNYDIGDVVRLNALFTDSDNDPVDPTAITLTIKSPAGIVMEVTTISDPAIVKDNVGYYHFDVNVLESGRYYYRWASSGVGTAAGEDYFIGKYSKILNA